LIASNDFVFRRARRKIQQVLMDAWDAVDLTSSIFMTKYSAFRHTGFKPVG
jgi:hypothetical protein